MPLRTPAKCKPSRSAPNAPPPTSWHFTELAPQPLRRLLQAPCAPFDAGLGRHCEAEPAPVSTGDNTMALFAVHTWSDGPASDAGLPTKSDERWELAVLKLRALP